MTTAIVIVSCAWFVAALAYRTLAFLALARVARQAQAAPEQRAPPHTVSLLRPLHGAAAPIEPCLESLFRAAESSGAAVMLGFSNPDDPVRAVVDRLRARWPNVRSTLRIGSGPRGANHKVANLIQLDEGDESEILVLCDADVEVPADFTARIAAPFVDPKVGLATCPYRSVPARSVASRVDALITNTHFIPSTCLAERLEGLHFGLGAAIAVRRSALSAAGGLEALLDEAADDYYIARNVERAGWRLAWVPLIVDHRLVDEGWSRSFARHLRWGGTMRSLRPYGYYGVFTTHGLVAALIAGVALGGAGLWLPLSWWLVASLLALPVRAALGLRVIDLCLLPAVDVAAFGAWLGGFFKQASPPS